MLTTFDLSHHDLDHSNCSCCLHGYPRKCSCGGLIHAESEYDESSGLSIVFKCDKCNFIYDMQEDE